MHIYIYEQVSFPVYLAGTWRSLRNSSLQLASDLRLAGTPNAFQSIPVTIKPDWDLLQESHYLTLLNCVLQVGSDKVWTDTINAIYEDVEDTFDLMRNLSSVPRRISPTTHATCMLMPSQKFIKHVVRDGVPDNMDEIVSDCASRYWAFFVTRIISCLRILLLSLTPF